MGLKTLGLFSPRPLFPNIADSFRRDAKFGRQQCGRARCLDAPLVKDVDRLFGPQLHSIHSEHHLRSRKPPRLRARVDGASGRKLHNVLGRQRILMTAAILAIHFSTNTSSLRLIPLAGSSPSQFIPPGLALLPVFSPTRKVSFQAGQVPGRSGLELRMSILALQSATQI